jgi:V8-like Glu-specific endopeptidase
LPTRPASPGTPTDQRRLNTLLDSLGLAPVETRPVPASPLAIGSPESHWRFAMSDADRVMLGMGAALAAMAMLALWILYPALGVASIAITIFTMLLGMVGAGMILFALRRQLLVASLVAGNVLLLLVVGVFISASTGGGGPAVSERPALEPSNPAPPLATAAGPSMTVPVAKASSPAPPPATVSSAVAPPPAPAPSPEPATPPPPSAPSSNASVTTYSSSRPDRRLNPARCPWSSLVGGFAPGAMFLSEASSSPVTGIAYRMGSWQGEAGFARLEPIRAGSPVTSGESVVAREGYAVGGINVDSGQIIHAFQLVFMRIGPDGRLNKDDTYTSDWVGNPVGEKQNILSNGVSVVGIVGRRVMVVHTIGLVYAPKSLEGALALDDRIADVTAAEPDRSPPPIRPGLPSGPLTQPGDSLPSTAGETPRPTTTTTGGDPPSRDDKVPSSVLENLKSVAVVEHPFGSGSGFVVDEGLVATNAHVVDGAFPEEIKVQFGTENKRPRRITRILHFDRKRDLCLIEVEAGLPPLPVRGDYLMRPGDPVVLMGNPSVRGGILLRNASNHGRLCALARIDGQDFYQIDASVNPGWSGGPVLDAEGKVVAIVAMKVNDDVVAEIRRAMRRLDEGVQPDREGRGVTGITYGIPASALAEVLQDAGLRDKVRLLSAADRYAAQTVVQRLGFLSKICMLRIVINVPFQVRAEARALETNGGLPKSRMSRLASSKIDYVPLISPEAARRLAIALSSREVQTMEEQYRKGLDARVESLSESAFLDADFQRDLKSLAKKLKDAEQYAERPGNTYAAFSAKTRAFSRDFKDLFKRLGASVEDEEP